MITWYRLRWKRTKLGTVLATIHFFLVFGVVLMVAISPGKDWPWWPVFPYLLDLPFSIIIKNAIGVLSKATLHLSHGIVEEWLIGKRAPFNSLDLFWTPATLFLSFGTLWHYFWPIFVEGIMKRIMKDNKCK